MPGSIAIIMCTNIEHPSYVYMTCEVTRPSLTSIAINWQC